MIESTFVALVGPVALLYLAGVLTVERSVLVRVGAAVPGAVLLVLLPDAEPPQAWAEPIVVVVVLFAAAATPALERRWDRTGAVPTLAFLAAAGAYACLPDTERIVVVAGVLVVLALAGLRQRTRFGPGLALALTGLLGAVALADGAPRDDAIVGALATLGLLVLEPVARVLPGPRRTVLTNRGAGAGLLVAQAGFALAVSRTAGLDASLTASVSTAAGLTIVLLFATRVLLGPP